MVMCEVHVLHVLLLHAVNMPLCSRMLTFDSSNQMQYELLDTADISEILRAKVKKCFSVSLDGANIIDCQTVSFRLS